MIEMIMNFLAVIAEGGFIFKQMECVMHVVIMLKETFIIWEIFIKE